MSGMRRIKIRRIRESLLRNGPVVGIDSGVVAFGIAVFDANHFPKPTETVSFPVPENQSGADWSEKVEYLAECAIDLIDSHSPFSVACEFPRHFGGTKGEAAARRGDTLHLAHFCGFIHAICSMNGTTFDLVEAGKWNGQLKKNLVKKRLKRLIGSVDSDGKKIVGHAWDACGVALYSLGVEMNDVDLLGRRSQE